MNLQEFFNPSSIAIVGVSENPQKVGHLVAKNMLAQGYKGKLYFVHPSGHTILGKKSYSDISEIEGRIDLCILAIPAKLAVPYLDDVAAKGCKNVLLFAAGFKETHTAEGDALEKQLQAQLKKHDISLLGPNCIGFIHTKKKINATFFGSVAPRGNIGIISQSGALGTAMLDYVVSKTHLGLSQFISLGNKTVITESHALNHLASDPYTNVIGMYIEDIVDGSAFQKALKHATAQKPVVILKTGRTKEGSKAALSHTGSLVGDDAVFDAVVRQGGAIRADSFAQFQLLIKLLSLGQIPKNKNILVLSNAGGMGVLLTDELIQNNLSLVTVSETTAHNLRKVFDEYKKISIHNPIDLLGDASAFDYERAIELTMKEKDIGAVIVLLTPQANTEIMKTARVLYKLATRSQVPIYPIFMGRKTVSPAHEFFEKKGMASLRYIASFPKALHKIIEAIHTSSFDASPGLKNISLLSHDLDMKELLLKAKGDDFLNQFDSLRILSWCGIPTAKTYLATSHADLTSIVGKEGYPLVAKIASDKITHKTEVKGVLTGINTFEELQAAYSSLTHIGGKKSGCYIQHQYSGHELLVGAKRDAVFGTVLVVGLGGVYAELINQTVQFVYPTSQAQFNSQIQSSLLQKLVSGYRNMPQLKLRELYRIVMAIGSLMEAQPSISSLDINPLIVHEDGLVAVDARVILKD
ncbi:MAG: acetate--CoA ligase family protein [bacterium]|nr:acetate--CoA ligase family protein [bacterium]